MPPPTDSQQAIRAFIRRLGGHAPFAERYGLSERTAQRIYSGKAACPRAVLEEIEREGSPSSSSRQAVGQQDG